MRIIWYGKENQRIRRAGFRRICMAVLAVLLLLAQLTAFAEPGTVVTNNGGRLNMRKSPNTKARIIVKIKNGSTVEVLEKKDGWYYIRYDGYEGYVQAPYVRILSEAIGKEIYSNGDTLYLHEAPDENSAIIGMVNSQQSMMLEQISDQWALVSTHNVQGYIQTSQINALNDTPVEAATQKWEEGILQKETKLHKKPDKESEVVSTWPKGTGVLVSTYDKKWCMVQVSDEAAFGFALSSSIELEPLPVVTDLVDESEFTISAAGAKKTAEKALKQFPGFRASNYICVQQSMLSCDGFSGPLYRFAYTNRKGQVIYVAYVHSITGELLYKGDYSGFDYEQNGSNQQTPAPSTTEPPASYVYSFGHELVWDGPTYTPIPGTDIGQSAARSIADRYLASHYPRFSEITFLRVECRHETEDPMIEAGFIEPYYLFAYYVDDVYSYDGQLQYCIVINAFSGTIDSCSGPGEGVG